MVGKLAVLADSCEPVSEVDFPCYTGKYREFLSFVDFLTFPNHYIHLNSLPN